MERLAELNPRVVEAGRWVAFLAVSWVILRPALTITISLDDFVNPFFVYDRYGGNPFRLIARTCRDLTRNGHFNYLGESFGAVVFVSWNFLMSWGVRYSLIYATTKFVVLIVCVLAAARLLRTFSGLLDRSLGAWRARVLVAVCLFATLQIHVPFSLDPVASYPLFGYLPLAVGLLSLDVAIRALQRDDRRSLVVAVVALCVSIEYYEINVAIVAALAPIAVLLVVRARRAGGPLRPLLRRTGVVAGAPLVMTVVLLVISGRANRGYTGTDVDVVGVSPGLLARTIAGSLPGTAWRASSSWLGTALGLTAVTVASFVVAVVVILAYVTTARAAPPSTTPPAAIDVVLVATSPVIVWLAATVVQTVTTKVRADTVRLGYVYNYYAYGSVGVVLAALLVGRALPRARVARLGRMVLLPVVLAFVLTQMRINVALQREFDVRLVANDHVLSAYSDRDPEPQRCAALREWNALPFWLPYYREYLVHGINTSYHAHHGEAFCTADILGGG